MNDDHVYLVMLVFSIIFGGVTRKIQNATLRKWISSVVGLVVIFAVSGSHTIHPIVSFILHVSLINLTPKENVHWVNFFVGFAYLVWHLLVLYLKTVVLLFLKCWLHNSKSKTLFLLMIGWEYINYNIQCILLRHFCKCEKSSGKFSIVRTWIIERKLKVTSGNVLNSNVLFCSRYSSDSVATALNGFAPLHQDTPTPSR